METPPNKRFLVALSFAGENREFVEQVANILSIHLGKEKIFYDNFYKAELARPNLDTFLQDIYKEKSNLIAVFLCENYAVKEWCGLEWRVVRDIIKHKQDSDVMPFRFDSTEIQGFLSIDGYIDIKNYTPKKVASEILDRLKINNLEFEAKNKEEKDNHKILINDLLILDTGSSSTAGRYNYINFNINVVIENISSKRINDLSIQVEIPYQLCNDNSYYDEIEYSKYKNKFIFNFEINKIHPKRPITTKTIYIQLDNHSINETIEENIKVTVFSDDEPIERNFRIKDTFKIKDNNNYQMKLINKEMFRSRGEYF